MNIFESKADRDAFLAGLGIISGIALAYLGFIEESRLIFSSGIVLGAVTWVYFDKDMGP